MKRFERIDKKRRQRFNSGGVFSDFYYSLRKSKPETPSLFLTFSDRPSEGGLSQPAKSFRSAKGEKGAKANRDVALRDRKDERQWVTDERLHGLFRDRFGPLFLSIDPGDIRIKTRKRLININPKKEY